MKPESEKPIELKNIDIVYFVKEAPDNEELRYSLRSVEKNFPYRKIWIYGGCPEGIKPDNMVPVSQKGDTKWDRVRSMLRQACLNNEITDDFVLFNDDFFVMSPVQTLVPYYRCPLYEHIVKIELKYKNKPTDYTLELRKAVKTLENIGVGCLSYELHLPMVLNRHKLLEILGAFPNIHCTRTLYGNYHRIGGQVTNDVKIYDTLQSFDGKSTFLSTDDKTFSAGEVGKYIRGQFKDKSRFEKE